MVVAPCGITIALILLSLFRTVCTTLNDVNTLVLHCPMQMKICRRLVCLSKTQGFVCHCGSELRTRVIKYTSLPYANEGVYKVGLLMQDTSLCMP